jgi:superfamily II DNA/RNA helicase
MPPEIRRLADKFLNNPREVTVAPPASPADMVLQGLAIVPSGPQKREALRRLIASEKAEAGLIFCNRKRDVDVLARSLKKHGFNAAALHGDMSQPARMETLENFKAGRLAFLVASDVAARGLDITGLPYVFNFDVPTHPEDYVHRIGRTGRAGRPGTALTLATSADGKYVANIEQLIKKKIPRFDIDGHGDLKLDAAEGGRGRGRPRGRGGKSAKPKTAQPASPVAEVKAAPVEVKATPVEVKAAPVESPAEIVAAPQESAKKPACKPRRQAKPRSERPAEIQPAANTTPQKPRRDNRSNHRHHRDDNGPVVVGLGDHMPAFLARPVVLPEKKR